MQRESDRRTGSETSRETPRRPDTHPVPKGSDKNKRILVVLLVFGLIIAIATQPEPSDHGQPNNLSTREVRKASASSDSVITNGLPTKSSPEETIRQNFQETRALSKIDIDTLSGLELFVPAPDLRVSAPTTKVQAIYQTESGHAALLGESVVRDGQSLPTGGKVVRITIDGVEVSR